MSYALPIVVTVFVWWFSTGIVLLLDQLPRRTHFPPSVLSPRPPFTLCDTLRPGSAWCHAARRIARHSVETGAQRMVNRMLERPIGVPARWFPEEGPERIEAAMGDPIWDWLQTQVPDVVERIDSVSHVLHRHRRTGALDRDGLGCAAGDR